MPNHKPSLVDQTALCQAIAGLVRARLPIAHGLEQLSGDLGQPLGRQSRAIQDRLAQGQTLAQAIVQGNDRQSRILSATIAAGERSGFLDQALESWTQMTIANRRATSQWRAAMVYPALLMAVTVVSLGFTIWHLLPEYERSFQVLHQQTPVWFPILRWVREQLWWEGALFLALAIAPLAYWHWRRSAIAGDGLPYDRSRREHLHALTAKVASLLIDGRVPARELVPLSVAVTGRELSEGEIEQLRRRLDESRSLDPLSREVSALLLSLNSGLMAPEEVSQNLRELSEQLRFEARLVSERHARFLPMLVALVVGGLVVLSYVLIIYLPWIDLLMKIVKP